MALAVAFGGARARGALLRLPSSCVAINRVRSSPVTTAAGIRHALKIALGVFSEAVVL